jgi:hypothetical protein
LQDAFRSATVDDYVGANDGFHDTVYCDYGGAFVYADRSDPVYYGCETVGIDDP